MGLTHDIPLLLSPVQAGFPSPSDDHEDHKLDITRRLIRHPSATFYVRAMGLSMSPFIESGDLLVVDRSREVVDGNIIIAAVGGEFTVKKLRRMPHGGVVLEALNPLFKSITISRGESLIVWGTVTAVIRELIRSE